MNDTTDCDLKYSSDDLLIEDGDLALATDIDVLLQDIYNRIRIPFYSWALEFLFGSKIPEYVNMPDEAIKMVELKKDVIEILKRESRIVKDSWEVRLASGKVEVEFLPVGREEPVTLTLEVK